MADTASGLFAGGLSGVAATLPMTLVMEAFYSGLPVGERRGPLPPREIAMKAADAAGVEDDLSETQKKGLTGLGHFGYGGVTGSAYGAVAPYLPLGPVGNGVAYGLVVWAGSYLGWLPAAGVMRSAAREPAGKNAVMIAAHVVWGATLGLLTAALTRPREQPAPDFESTAGRRTTAPGVVPALAPI